MKIYIKSKRCFVETDRRERTESKRSLKKARKDINMGVLALLATASIFLVGILNHLINSPIN